MKIKFIERSGFKGRIGVQIDQKGESEAGVYYLDTRVMVIVRQKHWYIALFIFMHEMSHCLIDCIFPYSWKNFPEIHPWHNILDRLWKMPKSWKEEKDDI